MFDRISIWPHKKQPRTVVIEATERPPDFQLLADSIRGAMAQFCQAEAAEKFRPHLTLLRIGSQPLKTLSSAEPQDGKRFSLAASTFAARVTPLKLSLDQVHLIASHQGKAANDYETLRTFEIASVR